jgi:hypothetical protein
MHTSTTPSIQPASMLSKVIYKYELKDPFQELALPKGTKVLHVHSQKDSICFWAEVCPHEKYTEIRRFWVVPTGKEVPEYGVYIGTVHMYAGAYVFHVYGDRP